MGAHWITESEEGATSPTPGRMRVQDLIFNGNCSPHILPLVSALSSTGFQHFLTAHSATVPLSFIYLADHAENLFCQALCIRNRRFTEQGRKGSAFKIIHPKPSYTIGGNISWCSYYGKQYGGSSENQK